MKLHHWLKRLTQDSSQRRQRQAGRSPQSAAQVENLEDRMLLTLWTVNTLDDVVAADGKLSLREAVQAAKFNEARNEAIAGEKSADEIRFAAELFENGPVSINLKATGDDSGPLENGSVDGDLTIVGPGQDADANWLLSLDGQNATGIFSGGGTTLTGLEFRNSNVSAVEVLNGSVIIENSFFHDNTGQFGGAINVSGGSLTVNNSVFVDNTATMDGGAIYTVAASAAEDTDVIRDSEFRNNHADNAGGAIASLGSRVSVFGSSLTGNSAVGGGGIFARRKPGTSSSFGINPTTEVFDSVVHANIATVNGGGIRVLSGPLTIGNSQITENSATGVGGGISLFPGSETTSTALTVTETTVAGNVAATGAGIDIQSTSSSFVQAVIERSTLSGNVASEKGGGLSTQGETKTTIVNTTISGNYANEIGGGIFQDDGRLLMVNNTVVLNRSDADNSGVEGGGGLAIDGLATGETQSDTQLFNTIVAGNLVGQTGVQTVDNSAAGFSEIGEWTNVAGGFGGNARQTAAGSGADTAEWTFDDLEPGSYRALTTWTASDSQATNAPFSVRDGSRVLRTTRLNQTRSPLAHAGDGASSFQSLGTFTITGGSLVVALSNDANGTVLADAVRIQRVDDGSDIGDLQNSYDIHLVNADATINVDRSWHNLIGDPKSSGGLTDDPQDVANNNFVGAAGDQWNINRIIFTELSDNLGGVTTVHALKADSPAIDEGSPFLLSATEGIPYDTNGAFRPTSNLITSDQRGYPFLRADEKSGQIAGDTSSESSFPVDIGAYELQLNPIRRAQEIVVSSAASGVDGNYADGELTLEEAVDIANLRTDETTIRFSPELRNEDGTPAILDPVDTLDIKWDLNFSGGGTSIRVDNINIGELATVTFDNLTLTGGKSIRNDGHAIFEDVLITNYTATGFGAVHNSGTMSIRDSRLEGNTTNVDSTTEIGWGGAVFNSGELTIGPDVLIRKNEAEDGGGIYNAGDLTIVDSTIEDNTATDSGGGINNTALAADLTVRRSSININTAQTGGGIYSPSRLNVFDTTIEGNKAQVGGGVYFQAGLIERSTIAGNIAQGVDADGIGGGGVVIDVVNSSATIRSSTIAENFATAGNAIAGGIAIRNPSGGSVDTTGVLIESSTIAKNGAARQSGVVLQHPAVFRNVVSAQNADFFDEADEDLWVAPGLYTNVIQWLDGEDIHAFEYTLVEKTTFGGNGWFHPDNPHDNLIVSAGLADDLVRSAGERTSTIPLLPTSFAIDSGLRAGLLDQRGFPTTDNDFSNRPVMVDGFTVDDGEGEEAADIGAYESAEVVVQEFTSEILGASQFTTGDALIIGRGYDDGKLESQLNPEPLFLGLEYQTQPYTLGPGIDTTSIFGIEFKAGAQVTAQAGGKFGLELGYYLNSGSVDTYYDGLFGYGIDDGGNDDGVFTISTGIEITDGAVYTTSPQVGAFIDLVFEINASVHGEGCLGFCIGGGYEYNFDANTPLVSLNRQKEDANGNPLFIGPSGETTTRADGNRPALDGEIKYVENPLDTFKEEALALRDSVTSAAAGGTASLLNDIRGERRESEIGLERAEVERAKAVIDKAQEVVDDLDETISELKSAIAESNTKESDATKKGNGKKVGGGKFVTLEFGEPDGDLLGVEAEIGVGFKKGNVGIQKKVGKLTANLPEIALSSTDVDANNKLTASTDAFKLGSDEDTKRQVAALSVDLASLVPGGGTIAVDAGPLSIEATTASYNVVPRLAIGQDISVEPFFDEDHQASFLFHDFTGNISVKIGNNAPVTLNGDASPEARTLSFMPGESLEVDTNHGDGTTTVMVQPSINVGNRFSNKFDLEFDIRGVLEVLKLKVELGDNELFDLGPLYENTHALLEGIDLFDLFNETFTLPSTPTPLQPFTIGAQDGGVASDGKTPGNAIPLAPGTPATALTGVVADQQTFFTTPLISSEGLIQTDIRFQSSGADATYVRPPYAGLTIDLINVDGGNDNVISSFSVPNEGVDLSSLSGTGWNGNVWSLKGFEELVGSRAIFGVTFNAAPTSITATAQGGATLTEIGRTELTADEQYAAEQQLVTAVIENDYAFDIDNDGYISPTTDGELVVRFMRGITGDALIVGAVGDEAERTTAAEISAYLQGLKDPRGAVLSGNRTEAELAAYEEGLKFGRRLDVDDSATTTSDGVDPDVDGVLILRHMSGIGLTTGTGPALTLGDSNGQSNGQSLPQGNRTNPQDIADFIDGRNTPPLLTSAADVRRGSARRDVSPENFVASADVLAGSAPLAPLRTNFVNAQGQYTLTNYQTTATFDDVYVVRSGEADVLIQTGAAGTPSRTLPIPESLMDQFGDPEASLELRTESSDRQLGFSTDAPLFVQLPDGSGYTLSLAGTGTSVTHLVFDRRAGGNIHRDHTTDDAAPQVDFDLYVPDTDQWFEVSMAEAFALPAGVRQFELYPRDLINEDLFFSDNEGQVDLDLTIGLVLAGPASPAPTLNVTVLSDRAAEIAVSPIDLKNTSNADGSGDIVRLKRNGAYVELSVNDQETQLAASDGLDLTVDTDASIVVDDDDSRFTIEGGTWQNESSSDAFNGDFLRKAAGSGTDAVSWLFEDLPEGEYRVGVTWPAAVANSTDALFSVVSGDGLIDFVIDQTQKPTRDFSHEGQSFQELQAFPDAPEFGFFIQAGMPLLITLSDMASDGFVVADAVRIEPVKRAFVTLDDESETLNIEQVIPEGHMTLTITDEDGNIATDTFQTSESLFGGGYHGVRAPVADFVVSPTTTTHTIDLSANFAEGATIEAVSSDSLVTATITDRTLTLNIAAGAETAIIDLYENGSTFAADTFRISVGDANANRPTVANPIRNLTKDIANTFSVGLAGRYSTVDDFTLASLRRLPAEASPFDIAAGGNTTLVLDATAGPMYQPIRFETDILGTGMGESRLQVEGGGVWLNIANRDELINVPTIDLRGSSDNKLSLDAASALVAAPDGRLVVLADSTPDANKDTVERLDASAWTLDRTNGADAQYAGALFDVYTATVGGNSVELWVSNTIDAASHADGPAPQAHPESTLTRTMVVDSKPSQLVSTPTDSLTVSPNANFTVDVEYRVVGGTGDGPPAILIEAHFDSSKLEFNRVLNTQGAGDFVPAILANNAEIAELVPDNNVDTDSVVVLSWNDIRGVNGNDWPNDTGSATRVITLEFRSKATEGESVVNFTGESSAGYSIEASPVTINIDSTPPGFSITPNSLTVSESGTTDSFTIVLNSQPSGNVVLNIASSDTAEATVDVATVTFTAANWNTAQPVTITGVNDSEVDGDVASTVTVSVNAAASADEFDGLANQTVAVTTVDNDSAGFTLSKTSATVSEAGTSDSFTIVLNSQPSGNVVLNVASSDTGEATVDVATVTFTTANWNTAQPVTITGVNDSNVDGNTTSTVTVSVNAVASADEFDSLANQTVAVTTVDNDSAGFTLSKTSATVSEAGTSDSFTIVLNSQPETDVVLNVISGDTGEATVDVVAVTFTPENWDSAQSITITGVDDSIADDDQNTIVTVSVNTLASDDAFDGIDEQSVSVTNIDDEGGGGETRPGNVDGDEDFDASDAFLIQLLKLAGSDSQIDQVKGASPLTAAQIRSAIQALEANGDVDGDNDFDANDSFLIQLVKLAGSDAQIDLSKGASLLTAIQIRSRIAALGGNSQSSGSAEPRTASVMAEAGADRRLHQLFDADRIETIRRPAVSTAEAIPGVDALWTDYREWIDVL